MVGGLFVIWLCVVLVAAIWWVATALENMVEQFGKWKYKQGVEHGAQSLIGKESIL